MYEKFRTEFSSSLMKTLNLDVDKINSVLSLLDVSAQKYKVDKRELGLTVVDKDVQSYKKTVVEYLAARRLEGLSEGTLRSYATVLKRFFSPINKPQEELTTNDIRAWLFAYQKLNNISSRTLEGYRGIINTYFDWASLRGYVESNPCAKINQIRYDRPSRKALDQLDMEYIREACQTPLDLALVEFLYSTACRVSEACSVKIKDIDWDNNCLNVIGKGNKERTVYLNARAVHALERYLKSRIDDLSGYLFVSSRNPCNPHPLRKAAVEASIRRISERRKELRNDYTLMDVTPHTFRHTAATDALHNGMPVEEIKTMLGHADINTTMVYANVNTEGVHESHRRTII